MSGIDRPPNKRKRQRPKPNGRHLSTTAGTDRTGHDLLHRIKLLVALVVLVVAAGYFAFQAFDAATVYYYTVGEMKPDRTHCRRQDGAGQRQAGPRTRSTERTARPSPSST